MQLASVSIGAPRSIACIEEFQPALMGSLSSCDSSKRVEYIFYFSTILGRVAGWTAVVYGKDIIFVLSFPFLDQTAPFRVGCSFDVGTAVG